MRKGQRVYWHGYTPNPALVGTIVRTGTLRHEVQYDGRDKVSLIPISALSPVSKFGKCCPYCKSLKEGMNDAK